MKKTEIAEHPSIGEKLKENLINAGYDYLEDAREDGAEHVFRKIRQNNEFACISMLYGLERALQGVGYKELDKERKNKLLKFFRKIMDEEE
jgi:DNA transformation protein